jgi:hypothetical protein
MGDVVGESSPVYSFTHPLSTADIAGLQVQFCGMATKNPAESQG